MQFCSGYVAQLSLNDQRLALSSEAILGKRLENLLDKPDQLLAESDRALRIESNVRVTKLALEAITKAQVGAKWLASMGFEKAESEQADFKKLTRIVPTLLVCSRLGGCDGMSPQSLMNCYLSPGCRLGTPLKETIRMDMTVRTYPLAQRMVEQLRKREQLK